MKNVVGIFFAACMISMAACQEHGSEKLDANIINQTEKAAIAFDSTEHHFGKVTEGEKVEWVFDFTNTGKGDLVISNASSTCGCTVPDWPKNPIKPGEKGRLRVVFNSESKSGEVTKEIFVKANTDPDLTKLKIVANVVKP